MRLNLWKSVLHPSVRGKVRWAFLGVIGLAILAGFLDWSKPWNAAADQVNAWLGQIPRTRVWGLRQAQALRLGHYPERPFRLGLDLAGGAHLVYEADLEQIAPPERRDAMEGVRDVIERRVNAFGVSEPLVQTARTANSWRVVVELAGVKDISEAINQIGETPILEFKQEALPEPQRALTAQEQRQLEDYNQQARKRVEAVAQELRQSETIDFMALAKKYSEDLRSKDLGGALGELTRDGAYGELWAWAQSNGPGKVSAEPIETSEGWNILKVNSQKEQGTEVHAQHILLCFRGAERCDRETSKDEARAKIAELKKIAMADNFEKLARENSTEPGAKERSGDLGWFSRGMMVKPFEDAVFALALGAISEPVETQFGFHLIRKIEERPLTTYNVNRVLIRKKTAADYLPSPEPWKNTGLSGKHLIRANVQFEQTTNTPEVGLEFNKEGGQLFAQLTRDNIGKLLAIFLDGEPISVPRVQNAITDGRAVITGNFDLQEAKLLVQRLNAGALPVPIKLISQQTVGATLGEVSVRASLKAGLIGFALVALFMLLYYRLAGLLAVFALVIYSAIVLALFKLIPVTLTLSGIAGFILSIGMAVDANVLQFERLKEELRMGKAVSSALEDAFLRAWPSIRDSHLTTLFGALILFWFSTSLVKGFGLTLSLGVVVSLFSAITVTRVFLRLVSPYAQKGFWYGTRVK